MQNQLGTFVLAIAISTALSGCLVDKIKPGEETTISRTTNELRIYQAGDFIDYDVVATVLLDGDISTSQGTMRIHWENHGSLIDPISTDSIPVLKETTTLKFETGIEPDATTIRYISQDADGSIILHAIEDSVGDLSWLRNNDDINTSAPVIAPVIFDSPLAVGVKPPNSPLDFYVMEGCTVEASSCGSAIYQFSDDFTIEGDTKPVTTNLGKFTNPFELSYSGGILPTGSEAISILGDIRDACGNSQEIIKHGFPAGGGILFVFPEIGMIQLDGFCSVLDGSGKSVHYLITINNASFF